MIVLDTNVVSELMRPAPAAAVRDWTNQQSPAQLFLTSVAQAEILVGLELLPQGKRRRELAERASILFGQLFEDRILVFGSDAAHEYAKISAERRRRGRPIASLDAQIAAIARAHGAPIATRNIDDFSDCGVDLIDPWQA